MEKPYVVTMFVDADDPRDIDGVIGLALYDDRIHIKNWIIDEDEDPEAHT